MDYKTGCSEKDMSEKEIDYTERPVWISETMKSGGTLLHNLLDGHPEMFVYPEPPGFIEIYDKGFSSPSEMLHHYFLKTDQEKKNVLHALSDQGQELKDAKQSNGDASIAGLSAKSFKGYIRGAEHINIPEYFSFEEYYSCLTEFIERKNASKKDLVVQVIRSAVKASKNVNLNVSLKRWGFRENYNAYTKIGTSSRMNANIPEFIFSNFKEPKIIFIIRDPRGIVLSRKDHYRKHYNFNWKTVNGFITLLDHIKIVKKSLEKILEVESKYGRGNVRIIRYEDLVHDVKKQMQGLADFLDISYAETMLFPSVFGVPKKVYSALDFDGGKINPERAERWRKGLSKLEIALIESIFGDTFKKLQLQFNYAPMNDPLKRLAAKALFFVPLSLLALLRFAKGGRA